MRLVLLRIGEVLAWMALAFGAFLGIRVFFIFVSLINPGFCSDSCEVGKYGVPVALVAFLLGWTPVATITACRYARRHLQRWWVPHVTGLMVAHSLAMLWLFAIFSGFPDNDSRTPALALAAPGANVLASALLFAGVLLDKTLEPIPPEIKFFQEDTGE
jgi:hypothetical protein